jgi:hypothetical protein
MPIVCTGSYWTFDCLMSFYNSQPTLRLNETRRYFLPQLFISWEIGGEIKVFQNSVVIQNPLMDSVNVSTIFRTKENVWFSLNTKVGRYQLFPNTQTIK